VDGSWIVGGIKGWRSSQCECERRSSPEHSIDSSGSISSVHSVARSLFTSETLTSEEHDVWQICLFTVLACAVLIFHC